MTTKVLTKTYRWMVISTDGILKTPTTNLGDEIFQYSYPTEEEAVAEYQHHIDKDLKYPHRMVLIPEYEAKYVV